MLHLINPLARVSLQEAISQLNEAHDNLVASARAVSFGSSAASWGFDAKRLEVAIRQTDSRLFGKTSERFGEVVNMLATVEHLLAALAWFGSVADYRSLEVMECHPSTSNNGSSDLVLAHGGQATVWCEVTDVVAGKAGQNGKEAKFLSNLKIIPNFADPEIHRYLATSRDYSSSLCSPRRKWHQRAYRYSVPIEVPGHMNSRLVQISPQAVAGVV